MFIQMNYSFLDSEAFEGVVLTQVRSIEICQFES